MKKKVCFLHPRVKSVEDIRILLRYDERKYGFEFVLDDNEPDYVFASERIYYDREYMSKFLEHLERSCIMIFFAGECIAPDLNLFDYAVAYDKKLKYSDRIGTMPNILYHLGTMQFSNEIKKEDRNLVQKPSQFCNFIYSNANAHPARDNLFFVLNQYKHVDSLGSHLNNVPRESTRETVNWKVESIELKRPYKFSIAAENAQYAGYTSEKIMTSFQAHSIPIYWGNPEIEEEFNAKAFINANKFEDCSELIEEVRRIDEDDELWKFMISQPWRTEEQVQHQERQEKEYYHFLNNIFSQDIRTAKRVAEGTAPSIYKKWFAFKTDNESKLLHSVRILLKKYFKL